MTQSRYGYTFIGQADGNFAVSTESIPTLYCSFCGKSQHEVVKLIAGPSVFICDECIDVSVEIMEESEPTGRSLTYAISIDESDRKFSEFLIEQMMDALRHCFPRVAFSIFSSRYKNSSFVYSIRATIPDDYDPESYQSKIKSMSYAILETQEKVANEQNLRKQAEEKYAELMKVAQPLMMEALKRQGIATDADIRQMAIMFLDLKGFSKMAQEERLVYLDMLRGLSLPVLKKRDALFMNTWGDAIIAAFECPTNGLRCACKYLHHLDVEGIDARIALSWGSVRVIHNDVTDRFDIDGNSVNEGARLEAMGETGEVYITDRYRSLEELDKSQFSFKEESKVISKPYEDKNAGDPIVVHRVRLKPNS